MIQKKYSIFISSTYEDLKEERQALIGVALENGFIPVGMEQFHAAPASQWDVIKKMIDECDFYMLVIGGRYGSIDETVKKSYTEKEYDYAKSKGMPILVLIRKPSFIAGDKTDIDEGNYSKHQKGAMLDAFRNRVQNDNNTVDYFGTVDNLKYSAAQSLKNAIDYADDSAGWVRFIDVADIVNERIAERLATGTGINSITNEEIDNLFQVEGETLSLGKNTNIKTEKSKDIGNKNPDEKKIKFGDSQNPLPLSSTAIVMLFLATADLGIITTSTTLGGTSYQAGNHPLNADFSRREEAKWEAALSQLWELGYIRLVGNQNGNRMFFVNEKGFQLSDELRTEYNLDSNKAPSELLMDLGG